ncbi:MAG: exo-alpha-sialidase [Clostridia bacterium]|nr:exo-alpha-sialidase [Clostridia bacterium]
MKKIIFKLAVLTLAAMFTVCASALLKADESADYYYYSLPGDMDENGIHNVKDVVMLAREMLNGGENDLADVNRDGKISVLDVVCAVKTVTDTYEVEKMIDTRYLKTSYLENFYAESISLSAGNLASEWSAKYVDDGVEITVNVTDKDVYCADSMSNSDNIRFYIQPINSNVYADRYAIHVRCTADGKMAVHRWKGSSDSWVAETPAAGANISNVVKLTDDGWTVTVKIGYDYFGLEKEWSYGNVRLYPVVADATADGVTEVMYTDVDVNTQRWRCDTYFVVSTSDNGGFVRKDFDKLSFAEDVLPTNEFKDLAFLDNLATIESAKSTTVIREANFGASVFSDRTYGAEGAGFPIELVGKAFGCGPIAGSKVNVTKAGYVVLEAGHYTGYDKLNQTIEDAGWTLLVKAAYTPYNTASRVGEDSAPDLANWYVKYCEVGEEINFGKWSVAYGEGQTTPFDWESKAPYTILDSNAIYEWGEAPVNTTLLNSDENTYYSVDIRKWHGCPSIAVTEGGKAFAVWTTGDKGEGNPENYAVIAYSGDNGKTWTEFAYVNSEEATDPNKTTTVCDIQLWLDHETNTLHCFYLASSTMTTFEKSSAVWTFTISNVNEDFSKWEFSPHRYVFPGLLRNNILVLSDGTWLASPNDYVDERFTLVYASTDKGETWELRGKAYIPRAYTYDETNMVEMKDGSIWLTVRNSYAQPLQAYSFDGGYTWTLSSLADYYVGQTRFNFTRLSSGAILRVCNAASGRTMMSAYLSYDEGETWPYSITLCEEYSTYPDVDLITVDGEEQIHVIFDLDRYGKGGVYQGRVYHTVLTEEFIKANHGKVFNPHTDFDTVAKIK